MKTWMKEALGVLVMVAWGGSIGFTYWFAFSDGYAEGFHHGQEAGRIMVQTLKHQQSQEP